MWLRCCCEFYLYFRYSDLYFNSEEYKQAVSDLVDSKVYDEVRAHSDADNNLGDVGGAVGRDGGANPPVVPQPGQARPQHDDSFTRRR